jgi:hypothetical protein
MEDDATRAPSPRSKSARPPAALFMEPTAPPARPEPAQPGTDPVPAPPPTAEVKEPAAPPATEAEPPAERVNGTARAAPDPPVKATRPVKAAKKAATPAKATARKAATPVKAAKKATTPIKAVAKKATPAPRKATKAPPDPAPARTVKATAPAAEPAATKPRKASLRVVAEPAAAKKPEPVVRPHWWTRTPTAPGAVPELLAEAAVERFGDSVDRYVSWLRDTYPEATPDGLARLATQRLTRRFGYAALAGPVGTVALLPVQALLVLHIAATYGRDPRAPERVPELRQLVESRALAGPLLGRVAGRLLPGAGVVLGAFAGAGALDRTARRAVAFYRDAPQ